MNTDLEPYQGGTPEPYDRPQVPMIARDIVRPRLPEVGRIRLGQKLTKKVNRGGKEVEVAYPAKLESFRFTSRDLALIHRVADEYGGQVEPWASEDGAQWQVVSDATTIPVVVPRAELAFSQWFENWDGAVCRRRCDGVRDIVRDCPCTCVGRDRECLPTTRLSVMLPSIPGLGVWRVESHGFNAAAEILGTIELAAAYGAALLPANLTLAPRTKRRPDPKNPGKVVTNRFVVPVLSITASLEEMVETAQLAHRQALGILPSAVTYPDPRDDLVKALHATYRERFPKGANETPDEYRDRRIWWSCEVLGRADITTWNGSEAPETLTRADVQTLLDALESTASIGHPASEAQAGPLSPKAAGPADSAAPQGSAGTDSDEPGDVSSRSEAPAEHHTAEEEREATPADGTIPAGESRSDTGLPPGAAPTKPSPPRKRQKSGEVDLVDEAQKASVVRNAGRREIYRPPTQWLWTLPSAERSAVLRHAHGNTRAANAWLAEFTEQERDETLPALPDWGEDQQWTPAKLTLLTETLKAEGTAQ